MAVTMFTMWRLVCWLLYFKHGNNGASQKHCNFRTTRIIKFLFVNEFIVAQKSTIINGFWKINNWTIPYKLNERGINWTIYILQIKIKRLAKNHFRRKCISSVTKWLDIINAKHCISSNRRKGYARLCRDDIQPKGLMRYTLKRDAIRA